RVPGRFELHDLLRAYAAELAAGQLSAAERTAAVEAVIAWYTATAIAATEAVSTAYPALPGPVSALRGHPVLFGGGDEATRWYEQERVNLLCAVATARPYARRAQRPGQVTTAEVTRHLAAALCSTGRPEEGIAALTLVREVCRELADRDAEARVLGFLVTAHGVAGQPETGLEFGVAGLAEFGDDETAGTGMLLHAISRCLLRLDRPAEALGYLHAYCGICRSLSDQRGLASGLRNMGNAYWL